MDLLSIGSLNIIKSKERYEVVIKHRKHQQTTTTIIDFYSKGKLEISFCEHKTPITTEYSFVGYKKVCDILLGYINQIESSYSSKTETSKQLTPRGLTEITTKKSDIFKYKKTLLEGLLVEQEYKSSEFIFVLKNITDDTYIDKYFENFYTVDFSKYKPYKKTSKEVPQRIRTVKELRFEYNLEWLESKDYKVITEIEDFDKVVEKLNECVKNKTIVAVDTETTGLKFNRLPQNHPSRDRLLGICISWEENQGIYIPVGHSKVNNIPIDYTLQKLKYFLENGTILTHYGVFDWKVFWDYGINLNIVHDTYIIQYLVDVNYAKSVKKLKSLTNLYIRYKGEPIHQLELEDFFPKVKNRKQKIVFDALGEEEIRCYAPADADFTRQLFYILYPKLDKQVYGIYGIEIRLMKEIGYTEYYGFRISLETLQKRYESSIQEKEAITKKIYELAGEEFDINSPKQLVYILYTKLKFPVLKEGKTCPSTSRSVLQDLLKDDKAKDNPKIEIINLLLKYRELEKLISGFFQKLMNEHIDGWIFPHFNQAGTDSGRIAGYEPNLQQVSKKIRDIFVADSDEYYIFDADYSQIELRVMAGMAGDDFMIEAFSDPDNDIHVAKAALLHGIPEDKVDKEMRTQSKKLNFGIPYGMGPVTLAHEIFGKISPETIQKAKYLYDKYFETSPKLKDLFTQLKDFAGLTGYSITKFGRKRYIPDLKSTDRRKYESGLRKAGNTPIQGTAADILKMAYVRLATKLKQLYPSEDFRNPKVRIAGSVHDEVLLIVHKSINPWVLIKLARECMELKINEFPPIFIGMHVCNTWGDGKRDDLEIPIKLTDRMIKLVDENPQMFGYQQDPLNYVFEEIKRFRLQEIKDYINNLGFNSLPINYSLVSEKFTDLTCKKAVKDLFNNDLLKVLQIIYGEENVIQKSSEEFKNDIFDVDEEDEERMLELRNKFEGVSDEDYEDLDEEYNDLSQISKEDLLIEEDPIRQYRDLFYKENRLLYYDLYIKINISNITKNNLQKLIEYLKTRHTKNGYSIILELNGKYVDTKIKAIRLEDDILIKYIYNL